MPQTQRSERWTQYDHADGISNIFGHQFTDGIEACVQISCVLQWYDKATALYHKLPGMHQFCNFQVAQSVRAQDAPEWRQVQNGKFGRQRGGQLSLLARPC